MKIHTVIRIIGNKKGWYTNWPTECGVTGHTNSLDCDCQVPKNWIFPFDVHETWQELNKY